MKMGQGGKPGVLRALHGLSELLHAAAHIPVWRGGCKGVPGEVIHEPVRVLFPGPAMRYGYGERVDTIRELGSKGGCSSGGGYANLIAFAHANLLSDRAAYLRKGLRMGF